MAFAMVIARRPLSFGAGGKAKYQEALRTEAQRRMQGAPPLSGSLYIRIVWFHTVALAANENVDVDNVSKPIVDALKGIVYQDDSQPNLRLVQKIDARRVFEFERGNVPRPEVEQELDRLLDEKKAQILYVEVGESFDQRVVFGPIDRRVSDGEGSGVS